MQSIHVKLENKTNIFQHPVVVGKTTYSQYQIFTGEHDLICTNESNWSEKPPKSYSKLVQRSKNNSNKALFPGT